MSPLKFRPAARSEIREALKWYRSQNPSLGSDLLGAVDSGLLNIAVHPEGCHIHDELHRFVMLQRFPYAIYFRHDAKGPIVVAVAHTSRKPDYWHRRE